MYFHLRYQKNVNLSNYVAPFASNAGLFDMLVLTLDAKKIFSDGGLLVLIIHISLAKNYLHARI